MKKLLLVALSTFAVSAHAWQPSYYVGGNVSSWQFTSAFYGSNFSIMALEGVAGAKIFPYVSVEGRVGGGFTEGREDVYLGTMDDVHYYMPMAVKANVYGSLYFRPYVANERATLYGLLGVTALDLEADEPSLAASDTQVAPSWGVGVSFVVNRKFDVTAEWKKLINADDYAIRGGTLGFVYKF